MPSFVAPAVQAALVTLLQARAGLAGVQVTNGYAGDDVAEPVRIFTGDARSGEVKVAGLKAGRTFYQESAEFDVVIDVIHPDGTPVTTKARISELVTEVAQCVADNRTLGNVSGLNFAECARWDIQTRYMSPGSWSQCHYTIRYEARLT